jgi:polysaccharide biosynthesis protein PslE
VLANALQARQRSWLSAFRKPNDEMDIAKAVRDLGKHLKAEPLQKTDIIAVRFESSDPDLAARVLNSLVSLYLEKHLQVHRPTGEFTFFDQETAQLRRGLDTAEGHLNDFTREHGVVSAQYERDLTLQKTSEMEASLAQTEASIAETEQRIRTLERQATSIPPRLTTQLRASDNSQLLQQMKSTLLTLELKRSELLSKFEPTYPLVVEVEKQIRETRAMIAGEKDAPVRDETTDQNPTYEWVKAELVKSGTELSGLKARGAAILSALVKYRDSARALQQASIAQQDLLRTAKTEEDNYLLYLRKQEEARINDALDARGILNVAIAEPASVPVLPARSLLSSWLLSVLLAGCGSVMIAFAADFLDPSFRTPEEVSDMLNLPVLASIPKLRRAN